jgi:hypothetical protein
VTNTREKTADENAIVKAPVALLDPILIAFESPDTVFLEYTLASDDKV